MSFVHNSKANQEEVELGKYCFFNLKKCSIFLVAMIGRQSLAINTQKVKKKMAFMFHGTRPNISSSYSNIPWTWGFGGMVTNKYINTNSFDCYMNEDSQGHFFHTPWPLSAIVHMWNREIQQQQWQKPFVWSYINVLNRGLSTTDIQPLQEEEPERLKKGKKKNLNEKEGSWNSTVNYSIGGRRHWTTTYGCNVFPGFVHIHMGLLWHSQQMARGSNVELRCGMDCHESSKMPIPNQKYSVRRGFVRSGALWKTNEQVRVQRGR